MVFTTKKTAKFSGKITDSTEKITIDGLTTSDTTPENAKTQIDKILNIVNKKIDTTGMTRTITQEATE